MVYYFRVSNKYGINVVQWRDSLWPIIAGYHEVKTGVFTGVIKPAIRTNH